MKLIESTNNYDCVAAALAMVLGTDLGEIERILFHNLMKPFPEPWDNLPKVPDMNVICEFMAGVGWALMPFEYNPQCSPHPDCPPVPVYPFREAGNVGGHFLASFQRVWEKQLSLGPGLIEGTVDETGHMVAWSGDAIYDPRGCIYSLNVTNKFDFVPKRFWLAAPMAVTE
jgi:hypothetical protein